MKPVIQLKSSYIVKIREKIKVTQPQSAIFLIIQKMTDLKLKIEFFKMGKLKRATEISLREQDQFKDFKQAVENYLV